jgi:hypothetical protein
MIKTNEGKIDRLLRLMVAVVIILGAFYKLSGTLQIIAYVISAILLITAATGFCGLYSLFGINTKRKQD